MKTVYLLIFSLCLTQILQAQASKTVELTAGNLSSVLTEEEKTSITNLTLTGTMDARDFMTIRDEIPLLAELDMKEVNIEAYLDTLNSSTIYYLKDWIPGSYSEFSASDYSLSGRTSLTSVILPASLIGFDIKAFMGCTGLTSMVVPPKVNYMGAEVFKNCSGLTSVNLPTSVTTIGKALFSGCSSLTSIELPPTIENTLWLTFENCSSLESVILSSSLTSIDEAAFAGCSVLKNIVIPPSLTIIGARAFENCSALSLVVIPSSVRFINDQAFKGCTGLTTVTIPESVIRIQEEAFLDCSNLASIYSLAIDPPYLSHAGESVFGGMDTLHCKLLIPYGLKGTYESDPGWNVFQTIVEMPGIQFSDSVVVIGWEDESKATIELITNSNASWTINTSQEWLTSSPVSGYGSQMITFTAAKNATGETRTAMIAIKARGDSTSIVGLQQVQELIPHAEKVVYVTSGNLDLILSDEEKSTLTSLTIIGTIDARDMLTTSKMPLLTKLDLTQTSVTAISLSPGTYYANSIGTYGTNPREAGSLFSSRLTSLQLPSTLENIGTGAFKDCSGLTSIEIPSKVREIGYSAFWGCSGLTSIHIPSTIAVIGDYAFFYCSGLKELTISSSLTAIPERAFLGCSSLTTLTIPPSVRRIDEFAFSGCTELTTVILPASFGGMNHGVFMYCPNLTSIYSFNPLPPGLNNAAFDDDKSACVVYVPLGSKELYEVAEGWKDFINIVEMPLFQLSTVKVSIAATSPIVSIVQLTTVSTWETFSDQPWLSVSNSSGSGDQTLTLIAEDNNLKSDRTALVNVSIPGGYSQTITVKQQADYSNQIPSADAGVDQTVEKGSTVTLDGSASLDADNDELSYHWTAPEGITLNSEIIAKPTFTVPEVNEKTQFVFSLVVSDQKVISSPDQVNVTSVAQMPELYLSATTDTLEANQGSTVMVELTANIEWTASSDQDWLTVSPSVGTGNQLLTFTADANSTGMVRAAIVTVWATDIDSQTIVITQQTIPVGLNEMEENMAKFNCYPNPFTEEMVIEIQNPKQVMVTVDIYTMAGQIVKNLAIGITTEHMSLKWDGTNQKGTHVTPGVYICKVNEQTLKLVYGKKQ